MKRTARPLANGIATIFLCAAASVEGQQFKTIHAFGSAPDDGRTPGGIIISGGVIYGTTFEGGQFGVP